MTYVGVLEDEEELVESVHGLQDIHNHIGCAGAVLEDRVIFCQVQDLLAKVEAGVDQVAKTKHCERKEKTNLNRPPG